MGITTPKNGAAGTTDQVPHQEGPQENSPGGDLTAGETEPADGVDFDEDPVRRRAYEIWEADGRPEGQHESHWHRALKELGLVRPSEQSDGSTIFPPVKPGL